MLERIFGLADINTSNLQKQENLLMSIEWNGIETIIDGKIYTLWNYEAFNKYLRILTCLKRKEFFIWVNGAEWKDKFSLIERCPKVIKAIPKDFERTYNLIIVVNYEVLNVQSLSLMLME
jgi:hypothetical protein